MAVETKRSFCRVCHAACPLDVDVEGNRVVGVRGVSDDPIFEGYTCIKGRQLPDQLTHPARLRSPLLRSAGKFVPVTGPELFDRVAAVLRGIIQKHGPRSVASYSGTGAFQSSTALAAARAWHEGLGSPSFYTSLTIDQPAKTIAPSRLGIWEAGYHGFTGADVIMAIGYNPMVSSYGPPGGVQGTNPFTALRRAKQRGLSLIVVDPRRTELAAAADVFLQIRPGEDPTLLAGVIRVILSEGLHDREFCRRWVSDLDCLERTVEPFTPGYVASRCGIDAGDLLRAARLFAGGSRGTAGTGTGPNMAPHSSLTEHLTLALNTLCGRVNRAGDSIESGNFLSPATPRRAQVLPPTDPATGPPSRVRGLRGYHGEMPTATLAEEILMPGPGRIRALVVSGGNPVVAWPDQQLAVRALRELELLVVVDHRMTATAESAHAVVPPRLSLERADVPHVMDRWYTAPYTNYTPAVVEAVGDVYAEWEVFWELARRLGSPMPFAGGDVPIDRRPTDDEMIDLIYSRARMPLDEIRRHRGVVHEHLALVAQPADEGADARFTVAPEDLMAELTDVRTEGSCPHSCERSDAAQYPFRLVSRRLKAVLNSLGPELPGLRAKSGTTNRAYLNPDDMASLGVGPDELVEISSPAGSLVAVAAAASDVRRGAVSMAHGWGGASLEDDNVRDIGAPTNRVVSAVEGHDRTTGMAVQSAIAVRVGKPRRQGEDRSANRRTTTREGG